MNTYPIYLNQDSNVMTAFEIDSTFIFLTDIEKILQKSSNVKNIHIRKLFSKSPDVHITFDYFDEPYIVLEPWGDNSRYWIGLDDDNSKQEIDIKELENLFKNTDESMDKKYICCLIGVFILVIACLIYGK